MTPTPWQAEGEEKRESVRQMFAEIAPRYDLLNGLMSLSRHRRWREIAARRLELKSGNTALDICSGTGDFVTPLRKAVGPRGRVIGLDFCAPMLAQAQAKGVEAQLAVADACRLPIADARAHGVSVGWGIRNVPDIDAAHREIFRVLRSGGRFVSIDMAVPENAFVRGVSRLMSGKVLPALGTLFGFRKAYTYLPESTARFKSRVELKRSMESAGFVEVGWKNLMMGNICIHWGRKP